MPRVFRKQVLVCTSEGEGKGASKGSLEVCQKFRDEVKPRTLADIIVTKLGCTGQHPTGPTVVIQPDGLWYQHVTPAEGVEIIEQHLVGGNPVEGLSDPAI